MTDEKLKIWNTMFIQKTRNMRRITYKTEWSAIDYLDDYVKQIPTPRSHAPDYMYFNVYNLPEKKKNALGDMFKIRDGLIIISERMYALLQQFDTGATLFFEIPLFEYNQTDRRPGTYYILHIAEQKQALVPEESEEIKLRGTNAQQGDIWYNDYNTGKIAVSAKSAAAGADLWMDTNFRERIFVSDRLKVAIKEAGIKASALTFLPCKVIA
ncbi:MAG: DUF1629 domain-containing protein [Sulfitobacter sp.]